MKENIKENKIIVTGNTVIDAVKLVAASLVARNYTPRFLSGLEPFHETTYMVKTTFS